MENSISDNPIVPPTDNPLTDQAQPTTSQQSSVPTIQTPPPETKTPAKSKKRLILVIIIVATILSLSLATFFVYQNYQSKQQANQPLPTPTSPTATQPSPIPDPTANWKTYISEGGKFSFKYPSDWIYETQKPTLDIQGKKYIAYAFISGIPLTKEQQKMSKLPDRNDTPKPRKSFSIIYATSSDFNNLDADDLIEELTGKLTETFSQRDVALNDNIKAKEVRYACQEGCLDVLFNYNDMIFEASTIPNSEADINTLYQILSTFRFLSDTSDWNTFSNNFFNFTFRYPSELSVQPPEPKVSELSELSFLLEYPEDLAYRDNPSFEELNKRYFSLIVSVKHTSNPPSDLIAYKTQQICENKNELSQLSGQATLCNESKESNKFKPYSQGVVKGIIGTYNPFEQQFTTILFVNNNAIFEFKLAGAEGVSPSPEALDKITQILSTFQFTE